MALIVTTVKETVTIKTWREGATRVCQEINAYGETSRTIIDVARVQLDAGIRAVLIDLGWTPPAAAPPSD